MVPGRCGRVRRMNSDATMAPVSTFISSVTASSTAPTNPMNISAVIYLLNCLTVISRSKNELSAFYYKIHEYTCMMHKKIRKKVDRHLYSAP